MKSNKELFESYVEIIKKHKSSKAKEQADKIGLEYYGFGRYGRDHVITHITKDDKLVALDSFKDQAIKAETRLRKVQKIGDKMFKDMEYQPPDKDKATQYWKIHDKLTHKTWNANNAERQAWQTTDEGDWEKEQTKNSQATHKELINHYNDKVFDNASEDELLTVNEYTGMGYVKMNQYLWKGPEEFRNSIADSLGFAPKPKLKEFIDDREQNILRQIGHMDSIMDRSRIPKNATVYSGLSARYNPSDFPTDKLYNYKGFLSTSLSPAMARSFTEYGKMEGDNSKEQRMILEIKLKKNQKGLYVGGVSGHIEEQEHILPRNTKLKILGQTKINWGTKKQFINVVQAEIIEDEAEEQKPIREVKSFNQFLLLSEDYGRVAKEKFSKASEEAKHLGLRYYGFGRYGDPKTHQITHFVIDGKLVRKPKRDEILQFQTKQWEIQNKDAELKSKQATLRAQSTNHKAANNAGLIAATAKSTLDFQAEKAKHDVEKLKFKPEEDAMKNISKFEDQVSDENMSFLKELEAERKENDARLNDLYDSSRFSSFQLKSIQEYANEAYNAINKYLYTGQYEGRSRPEFDAYSVDIPELDSDQLEDWREEFDNNMNPDDYPVDEYGDPPQEYYDDLDDFITKKKEQYEKEYLEQAEKDYYDMMDDMGIATEEQLHKHIGNLDSAMDASTAPYDFISYSGLSRRFHRSDFKPGEEVPFKAFLSTSLDHRVAAGFSAAHYGHTENQQDPPYEDVDFEGYKGHGVRPEKMILKIKNKKGHKGIYVGRKGVSTEYEWLMPRNTLFKVIDDDEVIDDPEYNQVYRFITVEPIMDQKDPEEYDPDDPQLDLFKNPK